MRSVWIICISNYLPEKPDIARTNRFSDVEQQILQEMTGISYENRSLSAENLVFRIFVT